MAYFQKGQSGNPTGRPVGIRDRRTALRDALEGRGEALLDKAIERALEGDTAVLTALLSKLIPKLRPESTTLSFPLEAGSLDQQASAVVSAALKGEIASSAALELLQALTCAVRVQEATELRARIEVLEGKILADA